MKIIQQLQIVIVTNFHYLFQIVFIILGYQNRNHFAKYANDCLVCINSLGPGDAIC